MKFRSFAVIVVGVAIGAASSPVSAQSDEKRFNYDGDMLVRGFYVSRDLPLKRLTKEPCPNPYEKGIPGKVQTDCREAMDYYTSRFRLNMQFTPNAFTDIYYGIEVGDITFGADNPTQTGPGTGGKGSGAVNIETREMRLRFHDENQYLLFDAGVFPVGSPSGLVLATSGAGFRLQSEVKSIYSSFQLVYLRQADESVKDGDQNGYNDTDFKDTNLLYANWRFLGFRSWTLDSYAIYRNDSTQYDDAGILKDTSRLYWIGSQSRYKSGDFSIMMHGVANFGMVTPVVDMEATGDFVSLPAVDANGLPMIDRVDSVTLRKASSPLINDYLTLIEDARRSQPAHRRRHPVQSGAGQVEVSYQVSDFTTFAISAVGAGGQLGPNLDGTTSKYKRSRFYTTSPAFQFTEIALDTSGGYSIFKDGELTGLRAYKFEVTQKFTTSIEVKASYTHLRSSQSLNGSYNQFYGWWKGRSSTVIGDEWNLITDWRPFAQFMVTAKAAIFLPGRGYRFLQDAEYGSAIREYSLYVSQKF